jgi:hypothetical protein
MRRYGSDPDAEPTDKTLKLRRARWKYAASRLKADTVEVYRERITQGEDVLQVLHEMEDEADKPEPTTRIPTPSAPPRYPQYPR